MAYGPDASPQGPSTKGRAAPRPRRPGRGLVLRMPRAPGNALRLLASAPDSVLPGWTSGWLRAEDRVRQLPTAQRRLRPAPRSLSPGSPKAQGCPRPGGPGGRRHVRQRAHPIPARRNRKLKAGPAPRKPRPLPPTPHWPELGSNGGLMQGLLLRRRGQWPFVSPGRHLCHMGWKRTRDTPSPANTPGRCFQSPHETAQADLGLLPLPRRNPGSSGRVLPPHLLAHTCRREWPACDPPRPATSPRSPTPGGDSKPAVVKPLTSQTSGDGRWLRSWVCSMGASGGPGGQAAHQRGEPGPHTLPSSSVPGSLTGEGQCPGQPPWSWVGHLSGLLRSDPEKGPPWAEAEPGSLARGFCPPGSCHAAPQLDTWQVSPAAFAPGGGTRGMSRDHVTSRDVLLAPTGQPARPSASTH